ncbi:MAG: serine/threonine protein kinase [Oscillatoriaceae cyanobacterium Prado104]|jgi:serine/threonine protein kinase|nr:serine/threonine protein kinase [Oscillatoriaceae cyanobacterium Prado104]
MTYCINPHCQNPQNLDRATVCQSCNSNLLLKNRYRVFHTLGQSLACRTFLAVDEDQPSQPRCVIQQFLGLEVITDGQKQLNRTFRCSAKALDELGKHPQIPQLLASFELDGCQYLVQEYIEGRNLTEHLSEKGVCKELHIWFLLGELLPVLQFVHDSGIIHGDIKPANIIHRKPPKTGTDNVCSLQAEGSRGLALVDFGSAVPANSGPLKTDTVSGSAEYAAPEQIKGKAIPSSDIYSLGVTCIHLLTGMSPFDLFDIKAESWAWQDYLKVPVSARLRRILDKMVQREPSKRYRTAEAILQDMKYSPAAVDVILSKPQWTLGAWAGAVVALVSLVLGSRLPSPTVPAFTAQEPVSSIPDIRFDPPPVQEFDGEKFIEPTLPTFEGVEPLQPPLPQDFDPAAVQTLAEMDQNPVWAVAVTPNGRVVVSGNNDGTIRLLHKRHGKVLRVLGGHSGPVWSVAVSPNGNVLASGGADGTIKLWNLNSGQLLSYWDGHADGVFSVTFSPDGETLVSVGRDKTVRLWQADTGLELENFQGISGEAESAVFSPDRETLAIGSSDGTIELWNWRTGELKQTLEGHSDSVWSLAISPDGQTLASGSWDKTVKLWHLSANKSAQSNSVLLRTLTGHTDKVKSLAFSPDGDKLASGDLSGTIKLWQANTGEMNGTLKGHSTWVELAFNPQDKTLISGSFDDTIKVWQLSP